MLKALIYSGSWLEVCVRVRASAYEPLHWADFASMLAEVVLAAVQRMTVPFAVP